MNLDELRKTLSSEATERCKAQEKTIKNLHQQINKQQEQINEQQEEIDYWKKHVAALGHRCMVFTKGLICIWCDPDIRRLCTRKENKDV